MIEHLKSIFSNVNDWLKFAEAKNGVLMAFSGGAAMKIWSDILFEKMTPAMNSWLKIYFLSFGICAFVGFVISLMSFLPKLKIPWLLKGETKSSDNLVYYGHIRKYDERTYLDRLCESLLLEKKPKYSEMEIYYANQIIVNSNIAMRKYALFDAAMWFVLAGVITPVAAVMMWMFVRMGDA